MMKRRNFLKHLTVLTAAIALPIHIPVESEAAIEFFKSTPEIFLSYKDKLFYEYCKEWEINIFFGLPYDENLKFKM